jgi:glycosyltransferase involved in cell wall biosynthesis
VGIFDSVVFWGRVSTLVKHTLMAKASALLMASAREGWGLVVSEGNLCGTPAIVYDVPGLRDSVRHEVTGIVVSPRPRSLADAMIRLTSDAGLYARLVTEGRRWSSAFSLDASAKLVAQTLDQAVARKPREPSG